MKAKVVDMTETDGFTVNQIESLQSLYKNNFSNFNY